MIKAAVPVPFRLLDSVLFGLARNVPEEIPSGNGTYARIRDAIAIPLVGGTKSRPSAGWPAGSVSIWNA